MLLDERKQPEGIESQTYGRYNDSARDEIARLTAEFEKRNKVTSIPQGATSLVTNAPPNIQRSMERSHGKGAAAGGAAVQLKAKIKDVKQQWKEGV